MITNPFLPSPSAASAWAEGFVKGFAGPDFSTDLPENISTEDTAAFVEGVAAGQQGAIDGLVFSEPCVSAREPHLDHEPGFVFHGVEALLGAWDAAKLSRLALGYAGPIVALIELACTLPVHTVPPDQVLPGLGQTIVDKLSASGVGSLELFCAAGLDPTSEDCEILLSPLFKSLEQAKEAATDIGRSEWVVASWRTDASNSFRIADSS